MRSAQSRPLLPPLPSATLSPLAVPTADDDLLGSPVSCKTSSIPTTRVPCWVPLALPHLVGGEAPFDPLLRGVWMGTSWAGLGVQRPLQTPLPGSLPPCFLLPPTRPHGTPTPAALHKEGDLSPRVWEIHLENRDVGAWPGAGLKDCEQGTGFKISPGWREEVAGSLLGGDPEEAGLGGRLLGSAFAHPSRVGQAPCEPPVGRWVVGPEPGSLSVTLLPSGLHL